MYCVCILLCCIDVQLRCCALVAGVVNICEQYEIGYIVMICFFWMWRSYKVNFNVMLQNDIYGMQSYTE